MRKITKALAVTAATGGFMLSAAGAAVATDDKDDHGRDDHGYSSCEDECGYDNHDSCDDGCGLTFSVTLPCPSCGGYYGRDHDHKDDCDDDSCKSDHDDDDDDDKDGDKDDEDGDKTKPGVHRPSVKPELAKTGMSDVAMAPIGAGLVLGGAVLYRRSRVRTNA